jgi:TonB family protein
MEPFALYLFRSVIWLTGFAVVYFLFLRNERFFLLKRFYLVSGILISFFFPLLSVHYQVELPAQDINPVDFNLSGNSFNAASVQQVSTDKPFDYRYILLFLYLSGVLFFAFRLIWHIRSLYRTIIKANINKRGPAKLIRSSEFSSSFSFFNYVFVNPSVSETEVEEIMNHELVHVCQKHWFDLLIIELLRMLQWINPFAWIYTGFIRLNHEYLADEAALQRTSNPAIYRAALLNQMFHSPVISLANSFNFSLNKKRFDMMKKIITSPYRKLKVLLIIPVFAILLYAFAEPEFKYAGQNMNAIEAADPSIAKEVKGVVLKDDGKPFQGVQIAVTGTDIRGTTDASGNFTLAAVPEGSHLVFSYRGHLTQVLKPQFSGSMTIKLLKDPEYSGIRVPSSYQNALVVIDDVISEKPYVEALKDIDPDQIARMSVRRDKAALDKYGEKGKNGVVEITTRKKAAELGIKVPFRRQNPEDYPTFRGESFSKFSSWLAERIKYPADVAAKGIGGRVTVNFVIQPDGTISNATIMSAPDPLLGEAIVKAINESPRWEPAKNPESKEPFSTSVTLKFELPDKIIADDTYTIVEQMPEFPGGGSSLLDYIQKNLKYPAAAIADKIEGRVIVRFVVTVKGKVEDATVLKGLNPLLDAEALRVINSLSGWLPGAQGGKPVNVWYMVPVNFSLTSGIGQKAPDFTLDDVNGNPTSLSSKIGSKLLLIDFWASWCSPCRIENPNLVRVFI